MAIIRTNKTENFTVLDNHHINDSKLSLSARGLMSFMLSKPNKWEFTAQKIAVFLENETLYSVRKALQELEKNGYLIKSQKRDKSGKLGAIKYTLFETPKPCCEIGNTDVPYCEKPSTVNRNTANLINRVNTKNKVNTNKKESKKALSSTLSRDGDSLISFGIFNNVFLVQNEYDELRNLVKDLRKVDKVINNLSSYLKNNPDKSYMNHYAKIVEWFSKDEIKGPSQIVLNKEPVRKLEPEWLDDCIQEMSKGGW